MRTIQDLVDSSPLSEFDTCRVLYELSSRQLVEKIPSGEGPVLEKGTAVKVAAGQEVRRVGMPAVWRWSLGALVAASLATAARNPLNGLAIASGSDPHEMFLMRQVTLTRMERIRYALQVYFVQLRLSRGGNVVDQNVHWLSTQHDVTNWKKTLAGAVSPTLLTGSNGANACSYSETLALRTKYLMNQFANPASGAIST